MISLIRLSRKRYPKVITRPSSVTLIKNFIGMNNCPGYNKNGIDQYIDKKTNKFLCDVVINWYSEHKFIGNEFIFNGRTYVCVGFDMLDSYHWPPNAIKYHSTFSIENMFIFIG